MPFDISSIAGSPHQQVALQAAYRRLIGDFPARFGGVMPGAIARAPGRVDLMGSHTDYNGLPVLPMTIGREIRLALAPRTDSRIRLLNADSSFEPREFQLSSDIPHAPIGDWSNYARAAAQEIVQEGPWRPPAPGWRGFDAIAEGDIPAGQGVSSSSALVVASALGLLAANGIFDPDKSQLAQLMALAERYVGTEGGGMDQATSLLGGIGQALRIDFYPLRTRSIPLPAGISWFLINSRTKAVKTAAARMLYNRRPIECRLAGAVLAKGLKVTAMRDGRPLRLAELIAPGAYPDLSEAAARAEAALSLEGWTLERIGATLGSRADDVGSRYCRLQSGERFPEPDDGFQLGRRARHVFREAFRVNALCEALPSGDSGAIGRLLNESYGSCRDDYHISRPELDALHACAIEAGALGARIAGAGFGGCMIAAVHVGGEPEFRARLGESYFVEYLSQRNDADSPAGPPADDDILLCEPLAGACAIHLPDASS